MFLFGFELVERYIRCIERGEASRLSRLSRLGLAYVCTYVRVNVTRHFSAIAAIQKRILAISSNFTEFSTVESSSTLILV